MYIRTQRALAVGVSEINGEPHVKICVHKSNVMTAKDK